MSSPLLPSNSLLDTNFCDLPVQLNETLVYLGSNVIRPFNGYDNIPAEHREFAERAYKWLRMHQLSGTRRHAVSGIGPTKPGLVADIKKDMMKHELSRARRPTRKVCTPEQQAFPAKITSETMVWATEGALMSIAATTPPPKTLEDIPHDYTTKLPYVRLIADALKDCSNIIDKNKDSRQVRHVKCTSGSVFENEAWFLVVSTPIKSRYRSFNRQL